MKKKKISSLALKNASESTRMLGMDDQELAQYTQSVYTASATVTSSGHIIIKTNYRFSTTTGVPVLFRFSIYNHSTDNPNTILMQGWFGSTIMRVSSSQLNLHAGNTLSAEVIDDYLQITLTAAQSSRVFIEELLNPKGFSII